MGRIQLGNEKKPLKLENELISRPLINKNINKVDLKFSNIKNYGDNYYLINLSGNPFISKSALRIGVFLYSYFIEPNFKTKGANWYGGEVFYISDKEDTNDNHTEEDYFHCLYKGKNYEYPRPLKELMEMLAGYGIEITSSNLIKALNELHDFHYITLSPRPRREVGKKVIYTRTCFRHIRLYKGMMEKPFFRYLNYKKNEKK